MRKNYQRKGDFDFEALYAVRGDSTFNLLQFVNTLSIYEGVDQKFLQGSLTLTDANNLLRFYDMRNDIYIVGAFRTPLPDTTNPTAPLVAPYKRLPAVHVTLPVVVTLT